MSADDVECTDREPGRLGVAGDAIDEMRSACYSVLSTHAVLVFPPNRCVRRVADETISRLRAALNKRSILSDKYPSLQGSLICVDGRKYLYEVSWDGPTWDLHNSVGELIDDVCDELGILSTCIEVRTEELLCHESDEEA